jgi:outer membrane protein insertion porin family
LNTTFLYAEKIQSIVVVGEIRTNEDYIKSLLSFEVGDEYLEEFVAESVKRIYKTDLFMDVKVKFLLGKFEIEVVESPMINNIYFEGNKNIKQESLEKELIISKRVPFSKNKITLDVQRIIELYKRQGFLLVKVDVKMMKNEYNSVDIIFEVDEGKKSTIKYIEFMGNKFFSSYKLKKTILTTENRWWKFFASNDTYDSERIAYDGEVLKNYYLEQGYPSFNVLSVNSEILRDESGFKVTYNIDEGVRYKYGSITFDVKVDRLKDYIDVMQKAITIKKRDVV